MLCFLYISVTLCKTADNVTGICLRFHNKDTVRGHQSILSCDFTLNRTHWSHERLKVALVTLSAKGVNQTGQYRKVHMTEDWTKVKMKKVLRHTLLSSDNDFTIQMVCPSCDESSVIAVYNHMTVVKNQRPFLHLVEQSQRVHSRSRRSAPPTGNHCRLHDLHVNISGDLGLLYVYQPLSINAKYCKGSCTG